MFFRRLRKDKTVEADPAQSAASEPVDSEPIVSQTSVSAPAGSELFESSAGRGIDALLPDVLRYELDPETLDLSSGEGDIAADEEWGLEDAVEAIRFAWDIAPAGHHVMIACPADATLRLSLERVIRRLAANRAVRRDWVYVTDFENGSRLRAVEMPRGDARGFSEGVAGWLNELAATLPLAFGADDYRTRRQLLDEALRVGQDDALAALDQKAAAQSIALLRTPTGYALAPMHEGHVVKLEVFNQLPEAMRRQVEGRIETLQRELEAVLNNAPAVARSTRREIGELHATLVRSTAEEALATCAGPWTGKEEAAKFLAEALSDFVRQADVLAEAASERARLAGCLDRYRIHPVCADDSVASGAPVVTLTDLSLESLEGTLQRGSAGSLVFRPGDLHRANGGVIIVDADDLSAAGEAGVGLRRALTRGAVQPCADHIREAAGACSLPEPASIAFTGKVVLLGTPDACERMDRIDACFAAAFRVRGRVVDRVERTDAAARRVARRIVRQARLHGLLDFEAGGVARLVEECCRQSGLRTELSPALDPILGFAEIADRNARAAGRTSVTRGDVVEAIAKSARMSSASRGGRRGVAVSSRSVPNLAITSEGLNVIGRVMALGCVAGVRQPIGRPQAVTAVVRRCTQCSVEVLRGRNGRADAGRAAIISAFFDAHFADSALFGVAATVLTPSKGSADSGAAEVLALLSALSDVALPQGLAVAGDVDTAGRLHSVPHINERIEAHFEAGGQDDPEVAFGVVIPRASVKDLMLREEIVAAASAGRFHIFAAATVFEALGILSSRSPGLHEPGSILREGPIEKRIGDRLARWVRELRRTGAEPSSAGKAASTTTAAVERGEP